MTSFCGLCCSDCRPSRPEFFNVVDRLEKMLADLQIENYAELKAGTVEEFSRYPEFLAFLRRIGELRCPDPCRCGGGKPSCPKRACAKEKDFSGCFECPVQPECSLLDHLRTVHPHIDHHLDLIREFGMNEWMAKRKEHYQWQVNNKR